jgi:predicted transglutaminase-like cysteine proteinase
MWTFGTRTLAGTALLALGGAMALQFGSIVAATARPLADPAARETRPAERRVPADQGGPRFFSIADVLARQEGRAPAPRAAAGAAQVAALGTTPAMPRDIRPEGPFASLGFRTFGGSGSAVAGRWRSLQSEWTRDAAAIVRCRDGRGCSPAARLFLDITAQARDTSGLERIRRVNAGVNRAVRYGSDWLQHGVADRWSPPLKTLGAVGDCEDYAIAKFYILRQAGMAAEDLRIVLVRDRQAGEDHAVLSVRHGGRWLVLDNRWDSLEADGDLPHLRPVVALGEGGAELFAAPHVSQVLQIEVARLAMAYAHILELIPAAGSLLRAIDPGIVPAAGAAAR